MGPPGVGKTTLLREAARVRARDKRVVIVDTSNEIGGDGDIPHQAVGRARRMQVSQPDRQHEVMIEAVENHNPEVIIIDEIGRELEAKAARTIAERGVQLIGTAHGNTLENLLLNPTLSDLIGGIESVTLSDDEARRRGTQKVVLERRTAPTFDIMIEIQARDRLVVHTDVASAVDAMLRNRRLPAELRERDKTGAIQVSELVPESDSRSAPARHGRQQQSSAGAAINAHVVRGNRENGVTRNEMKDDLVKVNGRNLRPISVYAYGVARNRLEQAARRLSVPLLLTDDFGEAEAIVTLKTHYRRRPRLISDGEKRGTVHLCSARQYGDADGEFPGGSLPIERAARRRYLWRSAAGSGTGDQPHSRRRRIYRLETSSRANSQTPASIGAASATAVGQRWR